jgi:hypothetical protein
VTRLKHFQDELIRILGFVRATNGATELSGLLPLSDQAVARLDFHCLCVFDSSNHVCSADRFAVLSIQKSASVRQSAADANLLIAGPPLFWQREWGEALS